MGHPTATQDSLPDGRPAFPGGIDYPLGPNERFQVLSILLSQASPGALIGDANALPDLDPRIYALTDQRNTVGGAAELRSRMTQSASRNCCVARE